MSRRVEIAPGVLAYRDAWRSHMYRRDGETPEQHEARLCGREACDSGTAAVLVIPLMVVRVVVIAGSVVLLVGVWLWCAADEEAEKTQRARASSHARERLSAVMPVSASTHRAGRHRAPETGGARVFTPVWPSFDPDVVVPGSWTLPGTDREPTGRHALAA